MKRDEDALQREILRFLRAALPERSWRVFHPANGGARSRITAAILKGLGVLPGVPDLVMIGEGGRAYLIEVKTASGRLSPAQEDFRAWMVLAGVPHVVARSIADVEAFLAHHRISTRIAA